MGHTTIGFFSLAGEVVVPIGSPVTGGGGDVSCACASVVASPHAASTRKREAVTAKQRTEKAPEPVEPDESHDYDTDAPSDAQPDYDADETGEQ